MNLKYLLLIIPLLILIFLGFHFVPKIKFAAYKPFSENTRSFANISITIQYSPDALAYTGPEYCNPQDQRAYIDPKIIITNKTTNTVTEHVVTSEPGAGRIAINGGFTDPTNNYTLIGITYRDISSGCNKNDYNGSFKVDADGRITPIQIPSASLRHPVSLINTNDSSTQNVVVAPYTAQYWSSDFNADTHSDYFVVVPDDSTPLTTTYMIDIESNKPSQWFNKGLPVRTEKKLEELSKFDPQRDFILSHADMEELNKNPLFRSSQKMLGRE
jgi:hypothetical protein